MRATAQTAAARHTLMCRAEALVSIVVMFTGFVRV